MTASKREMAYVVGCDISSETGEGFLANSLIELVQTRFDVTVYSDWFVQSFRSHQLLRDRVLPLYFFLVCMLLRLGRHRVVFLNYVPIWNFLNAILARCGVKLGPITGSVLVVPTRASLKERIIRLYLQRIFITLSEWLLPRRSFLWCATPSVFLRLQNSGLRNLGFGFPYLNKIESEPLMVKSYDLFIYSNRHPIKNHAAVLQFLASPLTRGFKICYVGPTTKTQQNVSSFGPISEKEFNHLLASSRLYITLSFEDGGITGFKALAYGIPVLCPRSSGLAFAVQYGDSYCFKDPYNIEDIVNRASFLLRSWTVEQKSILIEHFDKLKEKYDNTSIKWVSSL